MADSASPDLDAETKDPFGVLARENEARRLRRKRMLFILGFVGVAAVSLGSLWNMLPAVLVGYLSSAALAIAGGYGSDLTPGHKEALLSLSRPGTKEVAPYLLEAYATSRDPDVRKIARVELPNALALVESKRDFDEYQLSLLHKQLRARGSLVMAHATLETIGRISGLEAGPRLERFYLESLRRPAPSWETLGERALEILGEIRLRSANALIGEYEARKGPPPD